MLRRARLEQQLAEIDADFQAVQRWMLYEALGERSRILSDGERNAAVERIVGRIATYGVAQDDAMQRALDHSFWMFMCDEHPEDVFGWDTALSAVKTAAGRRAQTKQLHRRFHEEFERFASAA